MGINCRWTLQYEYNLIQSLTSNKTVMKFVKLVNAIIFM